eukprot:GHVU01216387.1.p1 GENE.GHVU01216387.1~~GHVU01216387.1.p1  ORF type:complete len:335 (+),score=70.16 GHVU01216387.1:99-1103(+)
MLKRKSNQDESPAKTGKKLEKSAKRNQKARPWAFKFAADLDYAVLQYSNASEAYLKGGLQEDAIRVNLAAAELREKQRDSFGAAKFLETVAGLQEKLSKNEEAMVNLQKAARKFNDAGKPDSGSRLLSKAAEKIFSATQNTGEALKLYDESISCLPEDTNTNLYAKCDRHNDVIAFLLKQKMFDETLIRLDSQLPTLRELKLDTAIWKNFLTASLVCLFSDDVTEARRRIDDNANVEGQYGASAEYMLANSACDNYGAKDGEGFRQLIKTNQSWTFLSNEMVRLVKDLDKRMNEEGAAASDTNIPLGAPVGKEEELSGGNDATTAEGDVDELMM